jgi:hypothetical protein
MAHFTPILVDKDTDKEAIAKYKVGGIPDTRFADLKGEIVGQPLIGAQQDPKAFLGVVQDMAKKIKAGRPSKEAAALAAAKTELDAAVAKRSVAAQLAAIAKIEKLGGEGEVVDAAKATKAALLEAGQMRLDAARELSTTDKEAALKDLRKLATEYKGADIGTAAAKLVKELAAPPADAPK